MVGQPHPAPAVLAHRRQARGPHAVHPVPGLRRGRHGHLLDDDAPLPHRLAGAAAPGPRPPRCAGGPARRGQPVSQAGYVLGAWGVTLAAVGIYAASLVVRGRRLLRRARGEADENSE
ncbi:MAG: heme exporter protein CcmD [Acidimicrobiaceae bacterium]|nr:heme exporter protein CcmD [Acidimicrobiaceae bacterium]